MARQISFVMSLAKPVYHETGVGIALNDIRLKT